MTMSTRRTGFRVGRRSRRRWHDGRVRSTTAAVDLVVPVKTLDSAKSRLRGAADGGLGEPAAHARLALALAHDTVAAVRAAGRVRRLLVVSSDPVVAAELAAVGVEVVPDVPGAAGLNAAYALGAELLRQRDPGARSARCRPTCPRCAPAELDAADRAPRWTSSTPARGGPSCPDAAGTGTTLADQRARRCRWIRASGSAPRTGTARSGAHRLAGDWPGLRRDVDTGGRPARGGRARVSARTPVRAGAEPALLTAHAATSRANSLGCRATARALADLGGSQSPTWVTRRKRRTATNQRRSGRQRATDDGR